MRLSELSTSEQSRIRTSWIVPENQEVMVTEQGQPYIQTTGGRVLCTVRKESLVDGGFHRRG